MPAFDSPATLHAEAYALYREQKASAAALIWFRAREAALTLGDTAAAFSAGYWEAEAWRDAGEMRRAHNLLFLLLTDVPEEASAFDCWRAHMSYGFIQVDIRPELGRLQRQLGELESLAARQAIPLSDLHLQRGEISYCRGDWEDALVHYSQGWQNYDESAGGAVKYIFPSRALHCCLILSRREEAASWLKHLSVTNQDNWKLAKIRLRSANLSFALEAGDLDAVRHCVENGCGYRHDELLGCLFTRGSSLDPIHDPSDSAHPARKLAFFDRTEDVHQRYSNLRALLDYRLACLRFTVGLSAVDDLYYRQQDVILSDMEVANPIKLKQQLRSFRFTWHLFCRHAKRLDALLVCDWRTREASARWDRARAIATACNTPIPAHERSPHAGLSKYLE